MTRFLVQRLLQAAAVLLVMSVVVYGLLGLMPGDPIDLMAGGNPTFTPADAARLRALYGLDLPFRERYLHWLGAALSGDLGYSRLFAKPVLEVLLPRLGNTLLLLGSAFVLAASFALLLGCAAARRAGGALDAAVNLLCFAGISVPPFWLALLLIILFAVTLGWLPPGGMAPAGMVAAGWAGLVERLSYLVLPVATLTLVQTGGFTRYVRASMIEALRQDYIRTARAKGVSERTVVWRHALRNAMIPIVTVLALEFGGLFSGALITETMFSWPGQGKLIYDAVLGNDYNTALVGLLLATAMTLAGSLAADIAYAALDPRISLTRPES